MSVRTRLILAFLVLSVLPLTAVTLYSYGSSVGAFRAAVASESGRMALDLQQRLDTVTQDLGRQVGRDLLFHLRHHFAHVDLDARR